MLNLGICRKNNSCYSCKSEICMRAGDIGADCPKYRCDMDGDCEHCDFVKEYIKKVYKEEVTE